MIFDVAALAFAVVFSLIMMKKGGMKAVLSFTGVVLSIVVASMLYPVITDIVYATPLPRNLEEIVTEAIVVDGAAEGIEAIDAMPNFIRSAIGDALNASAEAIADSLAASVTKVIIDVIVFILLLIATKLLLTFVSGALNLTMKLPVLKQLNGFVGFVCGAAISFVVVWIAVALTGVLATSNTQVAQLIDGSYVVEFMSDISFF